MGRAGIRRGHRPFGTGCGQPTMAVFPFRVNRMEARRPMDGLACGLMLVLCLIWAMQQIVLKATATDFAPMFQIAVRSAVAGVLLGLFMAWRGERLDGILGLWRPGLLAGTLYALEFVLVGESLRHTSAGHVVVLLYTAPIFAALGLHWKLPDERLAAVQWLGVALAFGGVALAFLWRDGGARAAGDGHASGAICWPCSAEPPGGPPRSWCG